MTTDPARFPCDSGDLLQMRIKPSRNPFDHVALVLRAREHVAFVFVDNELCLHAQSLERVPEFERLRRRTLAVTIAHQNQGRRLGLLDESNGRALGTDVGIVIHGT